MSSDYKHTREGIIRFGFNPEIIESIARELSLVKDLDQARNILHQFSLEANKLPWPQDHDFGALVLQFFSVNANREIAKFMLSKAIDRAQWCATCATAGGEGLARMRHVHELNQALEGFN